MADKANFNLVILWEDELRNAAKACAELRRLDADPDADKEAVNTAIINVLNACSAALYKAEEDDACFIISTPSALLRKRKTK